MGWRCGVGVGAGGGAELGWAPEEAQGNQRLRVGLWAGQGLGGRWADVGGGGAWAGSGLGLAHEVWLWLRAWGVGLEGWIGDLLWIGTAMGWRWARAGAGLRFVLETYALSS